MERKRKQKVQLSTREKRRRQKQSYNTRIKTDEALQFAAEWESYRVRASYDLRPLLSSMGIRLW